MDKESARHTKKAKAFIKEIITSSKNSRITFAEFMRLALYAPGIGYYAAGSKKFGPAGDFVTAPEISPLFSYCVARQCAQILELIPKGVILEFGAGTGVMAADILLYLEKIESLPETYYILEVSPDLQDRQKTTLTKKCPHVLPRITWLSTLPTQPIKGVILANEVLDAMPVNRFHIDNKKLQEYYVGYDNEGDNFIWHMGEPNSKALSDELNSIQKHFLSEVDDYSSEFCLLHKPWINTLSDVLEAGVALLIDYGYPRETYYHPQRSQGTLRCHFRHRVHDNPLIQPGIQDITAHVDFTAISQYATESGFDIAGYTHQAGFLFNCGLIELVTEAEVEAPGAIDRAERNRAIKLLTLPTEMGELFKVIGLSRDVAEPLLAFNHL